MSERPQDPPSRCAAGPAEQRKLLEELAAELEPAFFKALGDPARVELLKLLIVEGPLDVDAIARLFPQDRSVVSRHLAALRSVGVLASDKRGRHVYYTANAAFLMNKLERLLTRIRALHETCCPPSSQPPSSRPTG